MPVPGTAAGIVLCGGRSARMGTDKANLQIAGQSFLQAICAAAAIQLDPVIVVCAKNQVLPADLHGVAIAEDAWDAQGPLAGLISGLEALRRLAPDIQLCWLGCCDAPFVSPEVIGHLLGQAGSSDAVAIQHAGRRQPLGAIYQTSILPIARQVFDTGQRSLQQLLAGLNTQLVSAESLRGMDPELNFLRNINTPADYRDYVDSR